MGDVDDKSLKEEVERCKQFLANSEMENGRQGGYNFAMDILDPIYLLEKLNVVSDRLNCEAKLHVAFGYVFRNIEEGNCG